VRVSYVKVAEYQRRGAVHFHCVVRLDRGQVGDDRALVEPPAEEFTQKLLLRAVRAAVEHVCVDSPTPEGDERGRSRTIRWGVQTELRALDLGSSLREAAACAAYIAKYATKSTEACGGADAPARRTRPRVAAGPAARAALRRVRVAARDRVAPE
jgi:hypothetical protein